MASTNRRIGEAYRTNIIDEIYTSLFSHLANIQIDFNWESEVWEGSCPPKFASRDSSLRQDSAEKLVKILQPLYKALLQSDPDLKRQSLSCYRKRYESVIIIATDKSVRLIHAFAFACEGKFWKLIKGS